MYQIVLTGPESTGKTSLAQALAQHYDTLWMPEYARAYLENLGRPYTEEDLVRIAQGQKEERETLRSKANKYLFADTSQLVMYIWSDYKYGHVHPWIEKELATNSVDLYLLCGIDIPWEADKLREHPNINIRSELYTLYRKQLVERKATFVELAGSKKERLAKAIAAIEDLD